MTHTPLRTEPGLRRLSDDQREDPLFIQSIDRALQVLSAFHGTDRALTLSEIARRANIDRSAAQRVVHTLRTLGYMRRDAADRGFLPGVRLLDHALDFLRLDPLVQQATPVLLELRRNAQERVDLSLFDGQRVVYAARMQSKRETFYATLVGHSVPTYCSSGGWAILAALPEAEARALVEASDRRSFTAHTLTATDTIMERVAETRQQGFSCAQEQILVGEIAIGAAVMGADGRPVGAVHLAGSLGEWEAEAFTRRFAPLVVEAARAISRY
ncbi:IclR family transcriptional regulator [Plastorhodobacter daqingensis]|uniref:IclR family transcriptional regulator n=1 Tax=Plastorhodobacter daqingensis TaxID=1387281 RepID=A0ABW2UMJ5_9RHOB